MTKKKTAPIITGIEVGTDAIKVVVGEFQPGDVLSVLGVGKSPSLKVQKGEVVNTGIVAEQLRRAVVAAEDAAGVDINSAIFLAVTGGHFRSMNSIGRAVINAPDRRIGAEDVVAAISIARGCRLPPDMQPLHFIDRCYRIDGGAPVADPLGCTGNLLEADVHIIYGNSNRLDTSAVILRDVLNCRATDIFFSGLASAYGVAGRDELEAGCLVIDIGAGVTEYAAFHGAGCQYSGLLTVGCEQAANDLAIGLGVPVSRARRLLLDLGQIGSVVMVPDGRGRNVEVEQLGKSPRRIPVSTIEQILELRFLELFRAIAQDLAAHGIPENLRCGVFLTGGGALLAGIDRLAGQVFRMPVKIAGPRLLSGKLDVVSSPAFATATGLIRIGQIMLSMPEREPEPPLRRLLGEARRLGELLKNAFPF